MQRRSDRPCLGLSELVIILLIAAGSIVIARAALATAVEYPALLTAADTRAAW